jgi:hypothetical protein
MNKLKVRNKGFSLMKGIRPNKVFNFILLFIIFAGIQISIAGETFQNNLLKLDVNENSSSEIRMTLYTNKPYSDSVVVNKKNNFEYIILLPETANSMTSKPNLNTSAGAVKDIQVKTQQYENQLKGYTKITILTTKPVQINTKVQTLDEADYQLSESDYNELIAQSMKKIPNQTAQVKKEPVAEPQKKSNPITPVKIAQEKIIKPIIKKSKKDRILTKTQNQESKFKNKEKSIVASKEEATIVEKQVAQKITQETAEEIKQKTLQENQQEKELQAKQAAMPESEVEETIATYSKQSNLENESSFSSLSLIITKLKRIIKNNFEIILAAVGIFLILVVLTVKKNKVNHAKQKQVFMENLDEKPQSVIDYTKNITNDMSWKEKYQTYMDTVDSGPIKNKQTTDSQQKQTKPLEMKSVKSFVNQQSPRRELDELFIDAELLNDIEERNIENIFLDDNEPCEVENPFIIEEISKETKSVNEIPVQLRPKSYYAKPEMISKPIIKEEALNEIIKSEFIIDNKKGFYLVDFENSTSLVGHIGEEFFVLKRFKDKIQGQIKARINERKGNSLNYMTKIGNYRALVEVTSENMNLLIEL